MIDIVTHGIDKNTENYSVVEVLDVMVHDVSGLFIVIQEMSHSQQNMIIHLSMLDVCSYRIFYEPLLSAYKKMFFDDHDKFEYENKLLIWQSRFLDIYNQENPIFGDTMHQRVIYLPFRNMIIEIVVTNDPLVIVCLGGIIMHDEENVYE